MCFIESQDTTPCPATPDPMVINIDTEDNDEDSDIYMTLPTGSHYEDSGYLVDSNPTPQYSDEHNTTIPMDKPNVLTDLDPLLWCSHQ